MSDRPADAGPQPDEATRQTDGDVPSTSTVGPYRLVRCLGEGGMGEVWLAEQTQPVRRQVALKLIKAGMDTAQVVARFDAERQALAIMNHPAIARVFDAGTTAERRPYFVMEFVRGESITAYCNRHQLATRPRLELFTQVCEGVQHAHQKGIIHRDLKPSNVLVTEIDGRAVPKIIDFGIAKATAQPLTERPLYTEIGSLIGTPEYMSPEQAEISPIDIDTRTDVYALGAILYELLTGELTFDAKRLRQEGLEAIRRTIREVEPLRPSTRAQHVASAEARHLRHPDPAGLARELRGDLDWITMRALEKDRNRRYGSAADLAADLRRHLDNQPVLASPPSTVYRMRKFVRRHRVGVGVAATLVAVLLAFAATTSIQARRISQERDRANREAEAVRALNDFLQNDVLAQAGASTQARPDSAPDPDLTVRTALDRAAARITGKFGAQPTVEASIRQTIGNAYRDLGLFAEAQRQVGAALELRTRTLGDLHRDTQESASSLALIYRRQGQFARAEELLTKLVDQARRTGADANIVTLDAMDNLAGLYREQGKPAQAEPLQVQAVELKRRVLGAAHPDTLASMNNLALLVMNRGRFDDAAAMFKEVLETRRRVSGEDHPETLTVVNNLATLSYRQGDYAQAQSLFTHVLEVRRRVLGAEHPSTLLSMNNLAMAYKVGRNFDRAEALFTETLGLRRRVLGEEHPDTMTSASNLATLYLGRQKYDEAGELFSQVLAVRRRILRKDHPDTAGALVSLSRVRMHRQEYAQAEALLHEALASYGKSAPDGWERFLCESLLGGSLASRKEYVQAEPLLVSGFEGMHRQKVRIPVDRQSDLDDAGARLVQLYQDWGKPEKAAEWRGRLTNASAAGDRPGRG